MIPHEINEISYLMKLLAFIVQDKSVTICISF